MQREKVEFIGRLARERFSQRSPLLKAELGALLDQQKILTENRKRFTGGRGSLNAARWARHQFIQDQRWDEVHAIYVVVIQDDGRHGWGKNGCPCSWCVPGGLDPWTMDQGNCDCDICLRTRDE